ncbi:conserved hypothetical protein [Altererythrobacter sp. B11]|uniref:hypothetical protein n=1 Tax=Altererythrobacter sp. B11 TaxID=2060312 RepID=UPI000DC6D5D0|nr:hypothetical protein [Altererythrobacter sp. B11]BBC74108.1 conserved hypothetical protein [Altererythrobacter sp. B11]
MLWNNRHWIAKAAALSGLALLAACATPPPPPPPPPAPPPPVQEAIPYRPIPPQGASYVMPIPPMGPDGLRRTINTGLTQDEALWHFRSGWNVAALNCNDAQYAPITTAYGEFLKKNAKRLAAANASMDKEFRKESSNRSTAVKAREAHMTQVYNYFALPAVRSTFCAVALDLANTALQTPPADVDQFALAGLTRYEGAFEQFFSDYEKYRTESAAWDAKYGERYGASQPGYVAVHGVRQPGIGATLADSGAPSVTGGVTDPDSGATIPLVARPDDTVSTPVVQPLNAKETGN